MWKREISIERLSRVEKPYITVAEYITDIIIDLSDAFVIQARTSVSKIFELMDKEENDIRNKAIE